MKDDLFFIFHIRDAINQILIYRDEGKDNFFRDVKTQDALLRKLEIIGEATKRISNELKGKYPDIPWKRMAGLRDKVIHDYFGLDMMIIWDLAEHELEELKIKIVQVIDDLKDKS